MQIVPPLQALKALYPTSSKEDMAKEMGFEGKALETVVPLWGNTCAVRLSYCLLRCGIALGREPRRGHETEVRAGGLRGKHIWMNQRSISKHLLEDVFGKPKYLGVDLDALRGAIGNTGGVISFYCMSGYAGGHIDIGYYDSFARIYRLKIEEAHADGKPLFDAYSREAMEIRFWSETAYPFPLAPRRVTEIRRR
jgi:hypothetical protein